jgi:hypothetical protein
MHEAHAWLPSSYAALSRPCSAPLSRCGALAHAASLRLPSRRHSAGRVVTVRSEPATATDIVVRPSR